MTSIWTRECARRASQGIWEAISPLKASNYPKFWQIDHACTFSVRQDREDTPETTDLRRQHQTRPDHDIHLCYPCNRRRMPRTQSFLGLSIHLERPLRIPQESPQSSTTQLVHIDSRGGKLLQFDFYFLLGDVH